MASPDADASPRARSQWQRAVSAVAARCQLLLGVAAVPLQACARGMLARRALAHDALHRGSWADADECWRGVYAAATAAWARRAVANGRDEGG